MTNKREFMRDFWKTGRGVRNTLDRVEEAYNVIGSKDADPGEKRDAIIKLKACFSRLRESSSKLSLRCLDSKKVDWNH